MKRRDARQSASLNKMIPILSPFSSIEEKKTLLLADCVILGSHYLDFLFWL